MNLEHGTRNLEKTLTYLNAIGFSFFIWHMWDILKINRNMDLVNIIVAGIPTHGRADLILVRHIYFILNFNILNCSVLGSEFLPQTEIPTPNRWAFIACTFQVLGSKFQVPLLLLLFQVPPWLR